MSGRNWALVRTLLALAGLLVAGYLTLLHYDADVPLVCSEGAVVDCASVITSPESLVLGLPVAAWGLLWFALETVLAAKLARLAPGRPAPRGWRGVETAWAVAGALSVVYLVYLEFFVIGRICLWCSLGHLLVLAIVATMIVGDSADDPRLQRHE
ncbi:MAG TPA: vitamin K epoxide reductase family protein [Limnochordia bacterium]|nr:vitamin K epoxide reductase family protein [Limnochordia bacterium]